MTVSADAPAASSAISACSPPKPSLSRILMAVAGGVVFGLVFGGIACEGSLLRIFGITRKRKNDHLLYEEMLERVEGFVEKSIDPMSVLSNTAALVFNELNNQRGPAGPNWVGFYLYRNVQNLNRTDRGDAVNGPEGKALVLGPFNGKPAVVKINLGKGVCGTAALERRTQLVPDVHKHPNHIACDSASQSEIVVPIIRSDNTFFGVMDLDSTVINGFGQRDKMGLELICTLLAERLEWNLILSAPYRYVDANETSKVQADTKDSSRSPEFDAKEFINTTIGSSPAVIFSKSYCPYCKRVKNLFNKIEATFTVIELDQDPHGSEYAAELEERTGRSSVPYVYVGREFLGGCEDGPGVFPLHEKGDLVLKLKQAGAM